MSLLPPVKALYKLVVSLETEEECLGLQCAAKVSDFEGPILCQFYAYLDFSDSFYIKYCTMGIFRFCTVEVRIFPEKSWQH